MPVAPFEGLFHGLERRQRCVAGEPAGKFPYKSGHWRMPDSVETEDVHFMQSFIGEKFVEGYAVGGDENAGAVVAQAAMHKDLFVGIAAEYGEELRDLRICRRR